MDTKLTIDHLPISARAKNVLRCIEVETLEELQTWFKSNTTGALLKLPNCGRKTLYEIQALALDFIDDAVPKGELIRDITTLRAEIEILKATHNIKNLARRSNLALRVMRHEFQRRKENLENRV